MQFDFGLRHATAVRSACRDFRPGREPPAAPAPETSGQTQHEIPLSGRIDCSECRKNSNISTKKRDDFLFFSLLWLFLYMVYIFPYIVHRPETIGIPVPDLALRNAEILVPSGSEAPFRNPAKRSFSIGRHRRIPKNRDRRIDPQIPQSAESADRTNHAR